MPPLSCVSTPRDAGYDIVSSLIAARLA